MCSSTRKSNRPVILFISIFSSISAGFAPSMGQAAVIDNITVDLPGGIYPSPWNIADILIVGRATRGELRIGASGIVNSLSGAIGDLEGSIGVVSVSGDGASWTTSNNLTIGNYGHGTLTIGPGGLVSNSEAYVGMFANAEGSVTVSGQGAHWRATDRILIGAAGDATLTISDGARSPAIKVSSAIPKRRRAWSPCQARTHRVRLPPGISMVTLRWALMAAIAN